MFSIAIPIRNRAGVIYLVPGIGISRFDQTNLEVALLIANGYALEDIKKWMVVLGRRGNLVKTASNEKYLMESNCTYPRSSV